MNNPHLIFRYVARGLFCLLLLTTPTANSRAQDILLANPNSFPGELLKTSGELLLPLHVHVRPIQLADRAVPKLRSVTRLPNGRMFFASGLDQMVFELTPTGERRETIAWGQVRQVRSDRAGSLYFSCLLTPQNGEPLPDGFIYSRDLAKGENRAVLTFSQGDVGRDWWGAFDVHGDHIYVGTMQGKTKIYDVSVVPPRLVATLPLSATAFRFDDQGGLFACDGGKKLWHFTDLSRPDETGVSCDLESPLIDFDFLPAVQMP